MGTEKPPNQYTSKTVAKQLRIEHLGITNFLKDYPRMRIMDADATNITLEGSFNFTGSHKEFGVITDAYQIQIIVPYCFPHGLPEVYETDGKIPRIKEFHVNPTGSLCLGSRLRLLKIISMTPNLCGYAKYCIVPYLFAVSEKLNTGKGLVFGELRHGTEGELEDYKGMFGLETHEQSELAFSYLGMKRRHANKHLCPCGCGRRLGLCDFRNTLDKYRELAPNRWFRENCP